MPTPGQKAKLKQILKDSQSAAERLSELDAIKSNLNQLDNIKLYAKSGKPLGVIDSPAIIVDVKAVIESYLDDEINALFADAETTRKEANP